MVVFLLAELEGKEIARSMNILQSYKWTSFLWLRALSVSKDIFYVQTSFLKLTTYHVVRYVEGL